MQDKHYDSESEDVDETSDSYAVAASGGTWAISSIQGSVVCGDSAVCLSSTHFLTRQIDFLGPHWGHLFHPRKGHGCLPHAQLNSHTLNDTFSAAAASTAADL